MSADTPVVVAGVGGGAAGVDVGGSQLMVLECPVSFADPMRYATVLFYGSVVTVGVTDPVVTVTCSRPGGDPLATPAEWSDLRSGDTNDYLPVLGVWVDEVADSAGSLYQFVITVNGTDGTWGVGESYAKVVLSNTAALSVA